MSRHHGVLLWHFIIFGKCYLFKMFKMLNFQVEVGYTKCIIHICIGCLINNTYTYLVY